MNLLFKPNNVLLADEGQRLVTGWIEEMHGPLYLVRAYVGRDFYRGPLAELAQAYERLARGERKFVAFDVFENDEKLCVMMDFDVRVVCMRRRVSTMLYSVQDPLWSPPEEPREESVRMGVTYRSCPGVDEWLFRPGNPYMGEGHLVRRGNVVPYGTLYDPLDGRSIRGD